MQEFKVTRWQRYGHDRLYVHAPDGTRVGWVDSVTGRTVVEVETLRAEFDQAVRTHRGDAAITRDARPSSTAVEQEPFAVRVDWSDLAVRRAGQAAGEQAVAHRQSAPVKTLIARALGVHTDERAWRIGADGERKVGAQLERLPDTWTSLHSIPVGARGADIDHVVIGPGGVYTINAKHHPNSSVWVAAETFLVNGRPQPYIRNSRHEAQRASRLLAAAAGFPVSVTALVAVVGAKSLILKSPPLGVHVVARKQLTRWLLRQAPALPEEQSAAITRAARRSSTWR